MAGPTLAEFLEAAKPQNPDASDQQLTQYWAQTYSDTDPSTLPTLQTFLPAAKAKNPTVPDSDLRDYWQSKYGVLGAAEKDPPPLGVVGTLAEGAKSAGRSLKAAAQTYLGDEPGVIQTAQDQQKGKKDPALQALLTDIQQKKEALGADPSWLESVGAVGKAALSNPKGAGLLLAEQLPNSAVAMGSGLAGAAAGGAVGGPVGAVVGGLAGLFGANTLLETGGKSIEAAQDKSFGPEEQTKAIKEGTTKGAVVSAFDVASLGLTRFITGATTRAVESATAKTLTDRGVDLGDQAAVQAAKQNPDIFQAVQDAQKRAIAATNTLGQKLARGSGVLGAEVIGEGAGEYLGEYAATGQGDKVEAIIEALAGLGQSAGDMIVSKGLNRKEQSAAMLTGDVPPPLPAPPAPPMQGPTLPQPQGPSLPQPIGPTRPQPFGPTMPEPLGPTLPQPSGPSLPEAIGPMLQQTLGPSNEPAGPYRPTVAKILSAGSVDEAIQSANELVNAFDVPSRTTTLPRPGYEVPTLPAAQQAIPTILPGQAFTPRPLSELDPREAIALERAKLAAMRPASRQTEVAPIAPGPPTNAPLQSAAELAYPASERDRMPSQADLLLRQNREMPRAAIEPTILPGRIPPPAESALVPGHAFTPKQLTELTAREKIALEREKLLAQRQTTPKLPVVETATAPSVPSSTPASAPLQTAAEKIYPSVEQLHTMAQAKGMDIESPVFKEFTKLLTGKSHLDSLTPQERGTFADRLEKLKGAPIQDQGLPSLPPTGKTQKTTTPKLQVPAQGEVTQVPRSQLPPEQNAEMRLRAEKAQADMEVAGKERGGRYFIEQQGQGSTPEVRGLKSPTAAWYKDLTKGQGKLSKSQIEVAIQKIIHDEGSDVGKAVERVKEALLQDREFRSTPWGEDAESIMRGEWPSWIEKPPSQPAVESRSPSAVPPTEGPATQSPETAPSTGQPYRASLYRGEGLTPQEAAKNRVPSQYAVGEHWSPDRDVAESYGPNVRTKEVTLHNPYVFRLPRKRAYFEELEKEFGTHKPEVITKQLQAKGHDGLIVLDVPVMRDTVQRDKVAEIIVFKQPTDDANTVEDRKARYNLDQNDLFQATPDRPKRMEQPKAEQLSMDIPPETIGSRPIIGREATPEEAPLFSKAAQQPEPEQQELAPTAIIADALRQAADRIGGKALSQEDKIRRDGGLLNRKVALPKPEPPSTVNEAPVPYSTDPAPIFYSQMTKVLEAKMPAKASREQIKGMLLNNSVRADELKWSGLDDYLASKDTFTKPEILAFVRENQVEIREVEKGKPSEANPFVDELRQQIEQLDQERATVNAGIDYDHPEKWTKEVKRQVERANALAEESARLHNQMVMADSVERNETKFSQYQLPGGSNYRELLLTLPSKINTTGYTAKKSDDGSYWNVFREGKQVVRSLADTAEDAIADVAGQVSSETFKSSHFDEPNILAHVRFNERTVDGKKVLFLEEIQSDWMQAGRKKGFKDEQDEIKRKMADIAKRMKQIRDAKQPNEPDPPEYVQIWEERAGLSKQLGELANAVPDAPFKKTWHELALRRMLRYASEHGYDSLAFTTGEQQNERYDLSKQIDSIQYYPGTKKLIAIKDGEPVINKRDVAPEQLPDIIGKEAAEKILVAPTKKGTGNEKYHALSGLDLKVGGSGMKGFYDAILPAYLNKVGKKWGASVGKLTFPVQQYVEGSNAAKKNPPVDTTVHALPITDAMRKSVLTEGQALFENSKKYDTRPNEQQSLNFDLARQALGALDRAGTEVSATSGAIARPHRVTDGVKTVALGITPDLIHGPVSLTGYRVTSAEDLAKLAQVYRDPRFETFRIFYTKDGEIVGHEGRTSRLPGTVKVFKNAEDRLKTLQAMRQRMKALEADGYYILHNHPSGDSMPSTADITITKSFAAEVPGFQSHVVIDSNEYSTLDKDGKTDLHELNLGHDQLLSPSVPHPLLYKRIHGPANIVEIGKAIQAPQGYATLIYRASDGKTRAIQEIPVETLANFPQAEKYLAEQGVAFGSDQIFSHYVLRPDDPIAAHLKQTVEALIERGLLLDHVNEHSGGIRERSMREQGVFPLPGRVLGQSFEDVASESVAEPDSAAFRRWFGNSKVVNPDGSPRVVYHGTSAVFDKFRRGKAGAASIGMWFASTPTAANEFADTLRSSEGQNIMPAYLAIENPKIYDGYKSFLDDISGGGYGASFEKTVAATRARLKRAGHDGIIIKNSETDGGGERDDYVVFEPEQIKSATGNSGDFSSDAPSIVASPQAPYSTKNQVATSPVQPLPSRARFTSDLTPAQAASLARIHGTPKAWKEKLGDFQKTWKRELVQGLFDQYAPILDYSKKGYMLARMAKAGDGTLEALLLYGKPMVDKDGAYTVDYKEGSGMQGFSKVLSALQGEHDRFLEWVAAQRAGRLKSVGLENLYSAQDIATLKTLNQGKLPDGASREAAYMKALNQLNEWNDSMVKIAVDSGLISPETRELYKNVPYVPFYRLQEEGVIEGFGMTPGLVNQYAWKKLKGGTEHLNDDLLANLLQNWSHLITASAKNRAAKETLEAAKSAGVADEIPSGAPGKGHVAYLENGKAVTFTVSDPLLFDAVASLHYAGLGSIAKPFQAMKRALSFAVTANPAYKIRNLLRDTIQAIATSDLSYNPLTNISQGYKATRHESETRAKLLAGGGMMRFGSMLDGTDTSRTRRLIESGVDPGSILSDAGAIQTMWTKYMKPAFDAYQEFGDRGEQLNRAALYEQLLQKGMTHQEAAFWARDLMDFSMSGKWAAVRVITQVVPFVNARLQGLLKIGRAGTQDMAKLGTTLGAVALASIALMLAYQDDEDWKRRDDYDRENAWWFKIGNAAIRIPKPFEIGAIGTIAERSVEYLVSNEMTGERFGKRLAAVVSSQLSMNPTPQLLKPLMDIYANKDAFTGRPIETPGMERVRKSERFTEKTSETARFLGSLGLPDPAQLAMGRWDTLSPVQVDSLVRGYFSWLGSTTTTVLDYGIRPMLDRGERPDMTLKDAFLAGNFVESLPTGSSRYLTDFYDQAKSIEEAYGSFQAAKKRGDFEGAQAIFEEEKDKIALYRTVEQIKRQESKLNERLKMVESSRTMTGEQKRALIDSLREQKHRLAKQLSDRRLALAQ